MRYIRIHVYFLSLVLYVTLQKMQISSNTLTIRLFPPGDATTTPHSHCKSSSPLLLFQVVTNPLIIIKTSHPHPVILDVLSSLISRAQLMDTTTSSRKRCQKRKSATTSRNPRTPKKKQKRLDAIQDRPSPLSSSPINTTLNPPPRRSSRVRRPPVTLESSPDLSKFIFQNSSASPSPSSRRRKRDDTDGGNKIIVKERASSLVRKTITFVEESRGGEWGSRLRSGSVRGMHAASESEPTSMKGKSLVTSDDNGTIQKEKVEEDASLEEKREVDAPVKTTPQTRRGLSRKRKQKKKPVKHLEIVPTSRKKESFDKIDDEEEFEKNEKQAEIFEKMVQDENLDISTTGRMDDEIVVQINDKECHTERTNKHEGSDVMLELPVGEDRGKCDIMGNVSEIQQEKEPEKRKDSNRNASHDLKGGKIDVQSSHGLDCSDLRNGTDSSPLQACAVNSKTDAVTVEPDLNDVNESDIPVKPQSRENRRCGLCGRGSDGKPPKRLAREYADSENEAYNASSASEEPDYNVWDGFGDEPDWLGHLLGPIRDHLGIIRIWVHQHCAVWSPEVWFSNDTFVFLIISIFLYCSLSHLKDTLIFFAEVPSNLIPSNRISES